MSDTEVLFVSCTPGLEEALRQELQALGFTFEAEDEGFRVKGPAGCHRMANLHLRTASRVLLRLAHFRAANIQEFQKQARTVNLSPFLRRNEAAVFRTVIHKTPWAHSRQLEESAYNLWSLRKSDAGPEILIRLNDNQCTVSLDTSGEPLHMRGYRQEVGKAPLRETLAAGICMYAGYDGAFPLWDVMCGSGTLLIEAAMRSGRLAPGQNRRFAFESWPSHNAQAFDEEKQKAIKSQTVPAHKILGSDLNAGALGVTRRNARRAGVFNHLTLERLDATKLTCPDGLPKGLVVANLPYGKRVGDFSELPNIYENLGAHLQKAFPGWRYAFMAMDDRAAEWLGLVPEKVLSLDNGGLSCELLLGHF